MPPSAGESISGQSHPNLRPAGVVHYVAMIQNVEVGRSFTGLQILDRWGWTCLVGAPVPSHSGCGILRHSSCYVLRLHIYNVTMVSYVVGRHAPTLAGSSCQATSIRATNGLLMLLTRGRRALGKIPHPYHWYKRQADIYPSLAWSSSPYPPPYPTTTPTFYLSN